VSGGLPIVALPRQQPAGGNGQQVQHAQAGLWWPAADPSKLKEAAAAWRSVADEVDGVSHSATAVVLGVAGQNQGRARSQTGLPRVWCLVESTWPRSARDTAERSRG
jgi:hypothetical protein